MDARVRHADGRHHCLEVPVQDALAERIAVVVGEDEAAFVVEVVAGDGGLGGTLVLEDGKDLWRQDDGTIAVAGLERAELSAGGIAPPLDLMLQGDGALVEVPLVPGQAEELTFPQAGEQGDHEEAFQVQHLLQGGVDHSAAKGDGGRCVRHSALPRWTAPNITSWLSSQSPPTY